MSPRVVVALLALLPAGLFLAAQAPPRAAAAPGRQDLVVTNQNLALVTESRTLDVPAGRSEVLWERAPASARTETWSVVDAPAGVRWLGLTSPFPGEGTAGAEWLAGLIGKRVRIQRPGGTVVEGDVLAVHGATPAEVLFREGNELVYGEPDARISIPSNAPDGSRAAGVTLKFDSDRAGSRTITSRYLVGGVTWEASYALSLTPDEKRGRLEGFFVVDNRSGGDFSPSRLRLLAGTLRVASGPPPPMPMTATRQAMVAKEDVANTGAELSEARIYDVESPPRLSGGRTTFPLVAGADVAVAKRYVTITQYWFGPMEEPQRLPVGVQYRVETKPLARSLPAGVVRVYAQGVFTGEDRIEHTPERMDIEIESSEAFDLSARRRQVSFTQISRTETESAYEVVITSRKSENVTVLVREQFPGDWTIVESSVPAKKLSAYVAEFAVPVPAGKEAKLTYRVKVRTRG